jgi:hypothetical protein
MFFKAHWSEDDMVSALDAVRTGTSAKRIPFYQGCGSRIQ